MREHDAQSLADRARHDFPEPSKNPPRSWDAAPPVRVIDCVLSLNRHYGRVVEPRVNEFEREHPDITTCVQLRDRIVEATPKGFMHDYLDLKDPNRGEVLLGVAQFVIDAQRPFGGETEAAKLREWAVDARPGDYLAVGVKGFGLAGFQYLRVLFGADTAKPDRHIIAYVSQAVGHEVSDVEALYAMERAAVLGRYSAAWLDHEIWKRATQH
jgi:hypothetical protein